MRLTPETDRDRLRGHVSDGSLRTTLRQSTARRRRLQRNARIRSTIWNLSVEIDPTGPPARITWNDVEPNSVDQEPNSVDEDPILSEAEPNLDVGESSPDISESSLADEESPIDEPEPTQNGGQPTLTLSGATVAQPITEYAPREWDLLIQKARSIHEVGHLNFSDHADFNDRISAVADIDRAVAAHIWNAFEDGAIETQIRGRWPNYGTMLTHVRANFAASDPPGIYDTASGGFVFPLAHAIVSAIQDITVFESGVSERLLEPAAEAYHFASESDRELFETELAEHLRTTIAAIMTEPTARSRNQLVFDFLEVAMPVLGKATADGRAQMAARTGNFWGMPDDAHLGESGRARRDATELDCTSFEPVKTIPSLQPDHDEILSGTKNPTASDTQGSTHSVTGTTQSDKCSMHSTGVSNSVGKHPPDDAETGTEFDDEAGGHRNIDPVISSVLGAEIREQASETKAATDEQVLELERLTDAIAAVGDDLQSEGVVIPEEDLAPDETTYRAARDDSERLARLLRNRFQKQRKRSLDRNLRRGRLDPSALHRSATDGKRLKMQRESPDETDYHCLFVIDRSGSMAGDTVSIAEQAMGTLVFALESVDVNVAVMELYDRHCQLAKPFSKSATAVAGQLFNGRAQGGTPLSDTLQIAREQLKHEQGKRFLFVITDGSPSDPQRYMEALRRFTFPVVGINLSGTDPAGREQFHREVTVDPETVEIRTALRQLIQEVLFE